MDNWWIATLEHYGILTYDEAEHLSEQIANSIGNVKYRDASRALQEILENYKGTKKKVETGLLPLSLKDDVQALEAKVDSLKQELVVVKDRPDVSAKLEALGKDFERVLVELNELKKKVLTPAKTS